MVPPSILITQINYSSLLDLTSYNGSSVTVNNETLTKRGIKDMIEAYQDNPDASPVLLKTKKQRDGNVVHAGGTFWSTKDDDYKAVRQWILEGGKEY